MNLADQVVRLTAVSMGNPHAVVFVPAEVSGSALYALAQRLGPQLEHHPLFPRRTNVEFCHRHAADEYQVVVWERGCGITQACGTGACAVAVAACRLGLSAVDCWLKIELPGGRCRFGCCRASARSRCAARPARCSGATFAAAIPRSASYHNKYSP